MERREEGKEGRKKKGKKRGGVGKKEEKEEQDEMRDTVTMFLSMVRGGARCAAESAATHLESRWKRHFSPRFKKRKTAWLYWYGFFLCYPACVCVWRLCARPKKLPEPSSFCLMLADRYESQ